MLKIVAYPFVVVAKLAQLVPFTLLMVLCCIFGAYKVKYIWKV